MKKSLELSNSGIKLLITKRINGREEVLFSKNKFIPKINYFNTNQHREISGAINNLIIESQEALNISYSIIDLSVPNIYIEIAYKNASQNRINASKIISLKELRALRNQCQITDADFKSILFIPTKILVDGVMTSDSNIMTSKGKKIEIEGISYNLHTKFLTAVQQIFEKIQFEYENIYPINVYIAKTIRNPSTKKMLVFDMGYDKIIISKYINNLLIENGSIDIGAKKIVSKISQDWNQELSLSKLYLENFGEIPPEKVQDTRAIGAQYSDQKMKYDEYTIRDLSEIIVSKIDDMFDQIAEYALNNKEYKIVLIGGLCHLKGLLEYVSTRHDDIIFDIKISDMLGARGSVFFNLLSLNQIIKNDKNILDTNETKINDNINISNTFSRVKKAFRNKGA